MLYYAVVKTMEMFELMEKNNYCIFYLGPNELEKLGLGLGSSGSSCLHEEIEKKKQDRVNEKWIEEEDGFDNIWTSFLGIGFPWDSHSTFGLSSKQIYNLRLKDLDTFRKTHYVFPVY